MEECWVEVKATRTTRTTTEEEEEEKEEVEEFLTPAPEPSVPGGTVLEVRLAGNSNSHSVLPDGTFGPLSRTCSTAKCDDDVSVLQ